MDRGSARSPSGMPIAGARGTDVREPADSMFPRMLWYASQAVQHCGQCPSQISFWIADVAGAFQSAAKFIPVSRRLPSGFAYVMQGNTVPNGSMKQLERNEWHRIGSLLVST